MHPRSCVFEYLYRDAGNWKTYGTILLDGDSVGACEELSACLEWGNNFVAEQVCLPSLCYRHWSDCGDDPSELDHAYHEFVDLRIATMAEIETLTSSGELEELLERFRRAKNCWDVTMSPNCYL